MQCAGNEEDDMNAYEIATVVHDAHIEVDPSLNGQRVRVIILTSNAESTLPNAAPAMTLRDRLLALQHRFLSPAYDGSEVVDQRRESER